MPLETQRHMGKGKLEAKGGSNSREVGKDTSRRAVAVKPTITTAEQLFDLPIAPLQVPSSDQRVRTAFEQLATKPTADRRRNYTSTTEPGPDDILDTKD